jgi:hypothetical protein
MNYAKKYAVHFISAQFLIFQQTKKYIPAANISFAHTLSESRLFELNFNVHLFKIVSMKKEHNTAIDANVARFA